LGVKFTLARAEGGERTFRYAPRSFSSLGATTQLPIQLHKDSDDPKEGGDLLVPTNLSLLKLPPYSPELNAQENIWQFLRQNFLAGRIFDSYDDIVDACCNAWKALIAEARRITSIASRDWLKCVSS